MLTGCVWCVIVVRFAKLVLETDGIKSNIDGGAECAADDGGGVVEWGLWWVLGWSTWCWWGGGRWCRCRCGRWCWWDGRCRCVKEGRCEVFGRA